VPAIVLGLLELVRFLQPALHFVNAGPWLYAGGYAVRIPFVVLASLTYYMLALVVVRQAIITLAIDRLFRDHEIEVAFAHPDERGGLGFLGDFALGIAPLIAAAGLTFSVPITSLSRGESYGADSAVVTFPLLLLLYAIGSCTCFLAPLWSAHRRMVQSKYDRFAPLAQSFDLTQRRVADEMRRGVVDPDSVAKLEAAKRACDVGKDLPAWPIHVGNVRQLGVAILTPLLPVGVRIVEALVRP
jgi:hypothetical protein